MDPSGTSIANKTVIRGGKTRYYRDREGKTAVMWMNSLEKTVRKLGI